MRLDKLAVSSQEAFQQAMGIAADHDAAALEPEHLLKALLDSGEGNLNSIIERVGAAPEAVNKAVVAEIEAAPRVTGSRVMGVTPPSQRFTQVIDNAEKIAARMEDSFTTTEHLLIALADDKGA
ncbi:MAG: ATP-dependent chaperone ClpB, partial [Coriobacteriales bacterium]|nr:ATP-dependent chaperone ClpB [Coriobacteriales bacterium]